MKKDKISKKIGHPVTARIWEVAEKQGYENPEALRKELEKLGVKAIDAGNFFNMWSGKKKWNMKTVLPAVARLLGVSIDFLLGNRPPIPIVAEVSAHDYFSYREEWSPAEKIDDAINFMWESEEQLKQIYALRAKDMSMLPYPAGTIFYAQKGADDFKNFDLVVYCDSASRAQVRQLILKSESEHIILRSLNPAEEEIVLPRKHLSNCDPIVLISPRKL
jgi:protein-tyrosine-phosphatase